MIEKKNLILSSDASKAKIFALSKNVDLKEDSNFCRKFRLNLFL